MLKNMPLRFPRKTLLGLVSLLIALVLAGTLVLVVSPRPRLFAKAIADNCAQAPGNEHCHHQDPQQQGCAADAHTVAQQNIVNAQGTILGRVVRRYSAACDSWWGRIFDQRHLPGAPQPLFLQIAGHEARSQPTFVSGQYTILYSLMIYRPVLEEVCQQHGQDCAMGPVILGYLTTKGTAMEHAELPGYSG